MDKKLKDSTNKNSPENYEIFGKYTCDQDSSMKLEVSIGFETAEISFSDGEIIYFLDIWTTPDENILDPGVWTRCSDDYEIDFRKGWLILKKPDNKKLIYIKDK